MDYILETKNSKLKNIKYKYCVVIHLHYEDTVFDYKKYIKNIPEKVDIIFTYSNLKVREKLNSIVDRMKNKILFIHKENRGRDISAFLVAAKNYIFNYDIICFIHDKKCRDKGLEEDISGWIYSLWENTLASTEYINNIINAFEENEKLGILTPPIYFSNKFSAEIIGQWGANYNNAVELMKCTGVKKIPDKDSEINAFGTVFWARTKALEKLITWQWEYGSFEDEPLPKDGTLSHAIERCLWFYSEDAGYECHSVMTLDYANTRMQYMQKALLSSMRVINENLGCKNLGEIEELEKEKKKIINFCRNYKKIYIYGAGVYGKACLKILKILNINPEAFIVSLKKNNEEFVENLQVVEEKNVKFNSKTGIIIAVSERYRSNILEGLNDKVEYENLYIYKQNK